MFLRRAWVAGVVTALTFGLAPAATAGEDIAARLKQVPGLTVVSESAAPAGYRFFILSYSQPVDHRRPSDGRFEQRFQLLHKATERPMVLHTSGYNMRTTAFRSEPTQLVDGNQISVEQRFFTPSRPEPADWDKLNIWQAATDHHRIVEALKPVYSAKWISTGASKGGMTSVYHRRFYPRDVDGVVAYVAPNDSINPADKAYDRFFATVGNDPACRQALNDLQYEALKRRPELLPKYEAWAAANNRTFNEVLGTADKAYEMTVLDTAWAFWQYKTQADCAKVPAKTASSDEIYNWINEITDWSFYTDQGVLPYAPYYYQAATQLGWAQLRFDHLRGLTNYPSSFYQANSNLPPSLRSRHDPLPMIDIDRWVRSRSSQMLFVYGANDPWGAEPFVPSRNDSYTYTAPGANHGANIAALVPSDRDSATAALRRWAGVSAPAVSSRTFATSDFDRLEDARDRFPR
ncbi:S28 family serine protease [Kibdelosporangium persicum]|uniref:Secreted tripeptidyl aminopeptidase n=1 Tax=Kibdelosporangium persicum TaxID=2698649 RepID=A0ABX2FDC3_9PSEU|nr:S28 family serine protease [Kibdelosporangium persicum]NRN69370.1 Secreted tripeptidyl aminopeptidase [Kibdelosporangium persicum]